MGICRLLHGAAAWGSCCPVPTQQQQQITSTSCGRCHGSHPAAAAAAACCTGIMLVPTLSPASCLFRQSSSVCWTVLPLVSLLCCLLQCSFSLCQPVCRCFVGFHSLLNEATADGSRRLQLQSQGGRRAAPEQGCCHSAAEGCQCQEVARGDVEGLK